MDTTAWVAFALETGQEELLWGCAGILLEAGNSHAARAITLHVKANHCRHCRRPKCALFFATLALLCSAHGAAQEPRSAAGAGAQGTLIVTVRIVTSAGVVLDPDGE